MEVSLKAVAWVQLGTIAVEGDIADARMRNDTTLKRGYILMFFGRIMSRLLELEMLCRLYVNHVGFDSCYSG